MFKATSNLTPDVESPELLAERGVLSVIRDKRGLSTSISETLGALAIGVLVLGGIAFGIGAGYNYSQDSSAKSTLEAVKSAEILVQSETGSFGTKDELTAGEPAALNSADGKWEVNVTDTNYCAIVESGSMFGTKYWMTAKSGKILEEAPSEEEAGVDCPTLEPVAT